MRLPRFEKIRNQRQREFESALLKLAAPKPKNRFLAIINAPFTLWFLSAIVLGFGGVYYTTYKQCIVDATKISEDYLLHRVELIHRQISFAIAVESAKTLADVDKLQRLIPDDAERFKDKRLIEIENLLEGLSIQIEFGQTTDATEFAELKKEPNFGRFFALFEGTPPTVMLDDKDFPALKRFAQRAIPALQMQLIGGLPHVEPSCGPSTILSILRGAIFPPIVRAFSFERAAK